MIQKSDVIEFFDRYAPTWDEHMVTDDEIIGLILDNAGVAAGSKVLDVACGTGVLFPYYLDRSVGEVTAIDISPRMIEIAKTKELGRVIEVVCGDVEYYAPVALYDSVVVYNAFPHFPDPERLVTVLAGLVRPGGKLTIAHGMSRAAIEKHHNGSARAVSNGLMHEDELKRIFEPFFEVDIVISNDRMYQVAGVRREA